MAATRINAYQLEPGASGQVIATTAPGVAEWVDPVELDLVTVATGSAVYGNVPVWTASGWVASGAVAEGGGSGGSLTFDDMDPRYVNASGDTMTGQLTINTATNPGLRVQKTGGAGNASIMITASADAGTTRSAGIISLGNQLGVSQWSMAAAASGGMDAFRFSHWPAGSATGGTIFAVTASAFAFGEGPLPSAPLAVRYYGPVSASADIANKIYVDTASAATLAAAMASAGMSQASADSMYVSLSGDVMTGDLQMGSSSVDIYGPSDHAISIKAQGSIYPDMKVSPYGVLTWFDAAVGDSFADFPEVTLSPAVSQGSPVQAIQISAGASAAHFVNNHLPTASNHLTNRAYVDQEVATRMAATASAGFASSTHEHDSRYPQFAAVASAYMTKAASADLAHKSGATFTGSVSVEAASPILNVLNTGTSGFARVTGNYFGLGDVDTGGIDFQIEYVSANVATVATGDKLQQSTAPAVGNDLTNKTYVDATVAASALSMTSADARYVNASGDTMTGGLTVNHASEPFILLNNTTNNNQTYANESGVSVSDATSGLSSTLAAGSITIGSDVMISRTAPGVAEMDTGDKLRQGTAPTASADLTNKAYVDGAIAASGGMSMSASDARYVNASGDTMTGTLIIDAPPSTFGGVDVYADSAFFTGTTASSSVDLYANSGGAGLQLDSFYMTTALGTGAVVVQPGSDIRRSDDGSNANSLVRKSQMDAKPVVIPHTFTIAGLIAVPSGDTDYIPPFFVPVPAGRTAKIIAARHRINSGTSVTCKLQRAPGAGGAFADIAGFTGISVTTAAASTDPTDVALTDNDVIALVVTAIAGTPRNMSFTVYVEYT